eukprot:TRINITY_DN1241_c0_g1_i1.p1 TRINITY_DN1241_c0_g1~~TRINITY_DN1241_c0_g1_i1.p1  ORF type:complete len:217 (-),score=47.40 TRINITY_DN1241_c0_g1_i1:113-763(-)
MPNPKCEACGKTAYPLESVTALEKTFHKACFKCTTCKMTLNLKNFKGYEGLIYCVPHTPTPKATAVADSVAVKAALNAPKKKAEGLSTAHRGARETAPGTADFTVNDTNVDQSTENAPEESHIAYEASSGDQSTENNPEESQITYDSAGGDQSTENDPAASGIVYEESNYDQSTENAPAESEYQQEAYEEQPQYEQQQYEGEYQQEAEAEYQEEQQ